MTLKNRIEEIEKAVKPLACQVIVVTYQGNPKPPSGAADYYVKKNLCENCTSKGGICVIYWDGQAFGRE
ncbi:MAG: hypothetical protein JRN22_00430 [Nitrososphaerota archaeon]|nr:hypothetical protein [Nitrososphaerota archaeon]